MKTAARYRIILLVVTALVLLVTGALFVRWLGDTGRIDKTSVHLLPEPTVDPHEGQVYIDDGFGMVWITPLEGVDVNPFNKHDFSRASGKLDYIGKDYTTLRGVDVSEHQHEIDWAKVANSGIDFAFVRIGYRGYTQGGLFKDPFADYNLENAASNGLEVGVYFFSQAISPEEAIEEANYVLELLEGRKLDLPVVFDWEPMEDHGDARTNGLDGETLTECALSFCKTVSDAGYDAGIYFNRRLGYYGYDLSKLTDYIFWVSVPGDFPDFFYAADIWQYSFTENIPGIDYENDVNLMFVPKYKPAPTSTSQEETPNDR